MCLWVSLHLSWLEVIKLLGCVDYCFNVEFWMPSSHCFFEIFFCSFFSLLYFGCSHYAYVGVFSGVHLNLKFSFSFFCLFSACMTSTELFSSSLILSAASSHLLLSLSSEVFITVVVLSIAEFPCDALSLLSPFSPFNHIFSYFPKYFITCL